jgi:hypothetical protein
MIIFCLLLLGNASGSTGGWVQNSDGMLKGGAKVNKFRDQLVLKLLRTARKGKGHPITSHQGPREGVEV